MTRDEARAECIEAIGDELAESLGYDWPKINAIATAAFDSLHGLVRVVPSEATVEMVDMWLSDDPERTWDDMSAAGDLTNPLEKKLGSVR